jgi:hypothetical protein
MLVRASLPPSAPTQCETLFLAVRRGGDRLSSGFDEIGCGAERWTLVDVDLRARLMTYWDPRLHDVLSQSAVQKLTKPDPISGGWVHTRVAASSAACTKNVQSIFLTVKCWLDAAFGRARVSNVAPSYWRVAVRLDVPQQSVPDDADSRVYLLAVARHIMRHRRAQQHTSSSSSSASSPASRCDQIVCYVGQDARGGDGGGASSLEDDVKFTIVPLPPQLVLRPENVGHVRAEFLDMIAAPASVSVTPLAHPPLFAQISSSLPLSAPGVVGQLRAPQSVSSSSSSSSSSLSSASSQSALKLLPLGTSSVAPPSPVPSFTTVRPKTHHDTTATAESRHRRTRGNDGDRDDVRKRNRSGTLSSKTRVTKRRRSTFAEARGHDDDDDDDTDA